MPVARNDVLARSLGEPADLDDAQTFLLLDLYQRGESEAGNALARRYDERLRRYVRIQRGSRHRHIVETEDIVQAAYVELLASLETFEYRGKESLYAYLKQIAYNRIRSGVREAGARDRIEGEAGAAVLSSQPDREMQPDAASETRELEEILDQAMAELPDKFRDVLARRRLLEGTWKQLSEDMGYSNPRAVEQLYYRAKIEWLAIAEPRIRAWRNR